MLDRDRVERSPFERSPAERLFTLAAVVSAAQLLWVLAMGLIAGGQFVLSSFGSVVRQVEWLPSSDEGVYLVGMIIAERFHRRVIRML